MSSTTNNSTKIMRCLHCNNEVPMSLIETILGKKVNYIGSNELERTKATIMGCCTKMPPKTAVFSCHETFLIYQCPTCQDIIVIKKYYDNVDLNKIDKNSKMSIEQQKIIYPLNNNLDQKIIPNEICKIYKEASKLKNISPSSFGVQIRKALELLCEEQGAPKSGDLYNKLEKLSERNIFPENIINMGNIIRKVAKYGAHPKDEEITASDADLLDDIFHLILDYVYITPYKVKTLEDKFKKVNK